MFRKLLEKLRKISSKPNSFRRTSRKSMTEKELKAEARRFTDTYGEVIKKLSHE